LEDAEAKGGQHRRLELAHGPLGKLGDHVIERRLALHDAVGEPGRQRALARVELQPPRLAVQRTVGPRVLLEDAPDDRVRASARGRHARGRTLTARLGLPARLAEEVVRASLYAWLQF